ncbi:MAG: GNAT family N-acetyltransferase, partial [Planctomycetota bacterium]|nr:GNAT family N-acetyltransferase [Planctomycetota bacterium]
LMCGDRVASFHFNTIDRKHVQLTLITHNPLLAEHSPGKFHVLLLGRMLLEQGYGWIDLTPGGDPYKERFANAWDHVYTLTVFRNPFERRKAAVIESVQDRAKNTLTRWDIRPAHAKAVAGKLVRPSGLLHLTRGWLSSSQEALVYSRDARTNGFHATNQTLIRRDAIDDLMAYAPSAGGPTLHEFLSDAMRRIEDGQRVYTYAENGRLLHHAWFATTPPKELIATTLPGCELAEDCGLIVDSYTVPGARRRGLASASLAAMLQDASDIKDLNRTLIAVPAMNAVARRLVERAGFAYERSCVREFAQM